MIESTVMEMMLGTIISMSDTIVVHRMPKMKNRLLPLSSRISSCARLSLLDFMDVPPLMF